MIIISQLEPHYRQNWLTQFRYELELSSEGESGGSDDLASIGGAGTMDTEVTPVLVASPAHRPEGEGSLTLHSSQTATCPAPRPEGDVGLTPRDRQQTDSRPTYQ